MSKVRMMAVLNRFNFFCLDPKKSEKSANRRDLKFERRKGPSPRATPGEHVCVDSVPCVGFMGGIDRTKAARTRAGVLRRVSLADYGGHQQRRSAPRSGK